MKDEVDDREFGELAKAMCVWKSSKCWMDDWMRNSVC